LLVARAVFGIAVPVWHPGVLALTALATSLAVAGTSVAVSTLFVVSRSARTFQNSLTYPFYLLGGVFVPVSYLPGWLHPVSAAVFLSWSSDLLRAAIEPAPVHHLGLRLGMIFVLAAAAFAIGFAALGRILRRLKQTGTIGLT
jgi:ABC-2 type transport system permease protein